jgi:hypothetical protein
MALSISQSEVVDLGALPLSGYPFTLTGWFRVPNMSSLLTLMRVENTQTGSYHAIYFRGHVDDRAGAISKVGFSGTAKSTAPMIQGQWHQVTGVFEADNQRHVYLDGGNIGTSTHTRVFDGADQFVLGNVSTSDAVEVAESLAAWLDRESASPLAGWSVPS